MHPTELIPALRDTEKYKQWHKENPGAKLVHLFLMLDPGQDVKYDIGFYDFDKKLMTSFIVDEKLSGVEISESKEIFTKDQSSIKPLDEGRIKIHFEDACETCRKLQQEKYKQHEPMKEVVILQNLDVGQVWNITYIAKTFQTLNMKVDAETGGIVEEKLHQIFSFDKGEEGSEK
jgi:hypothetical protein